MADYDLDVWCLAGSVPVSAVAQQVERITGLPSGAYFEVALRYRRGVLYNPGAEDTDNPDGWPSISRGNFTTTVDPAEIAAAVWTRESAVLERITLTITPNADALSGDIHVYRRTSADSELTLLDTIAGPHTDPVTYEDDTISGETIYYYALSTETDEEGPQGAETRIWSGPPEIPVRTYLNEYLEGYIVGGTLSPAGADVELHDTYDDNGGVEAFSLRETDTSGVSPWEITASAVPLANVPVDGIDFHARLRVAELSFTITDYGEFGTSFPVSVEGSEFE